MAGTLFALERLRDLAPATIVPGHGPVAGLELITATEDYVHWVNKLAIDGLSAGRTPLETAQAADLGRFASLLDRERLAPNLHRAYAELTGTPLGAPINLPAAMQDMTVFRGRRPV